MAASIRKSRLEIENRCTDCPCIGLLAASIRKSGLEIENRCTDCPCFDLLVASIRKSGPEIRNRCTEVPEICPIAAVIVNSGPEIKNHCSAIVPASRIARLRSRCRNGAASDSNFLRRKVERPACAVVAATLPRPILIFFASKKNVPPAEARCRSIEWPACSIRSRIDELPSCRMTVAGAGGDRLPRRRHNPK